MQRANARSDLYQIRIKGHLGQWADWFGGLSITLDDNGDTVLTGRWSIRAQYMGCWKKWGIWGNHCSGEQRQKDHRDTIIKEEAQGIATQKSPVPGAGWSGLGRGGHSPSSGSGTDGAGTCQCLELGGPGSGGHSFIRFWSFCVVGNGVFLSPPAKEKSPPRGGGVGRPGVGGRALGAAPPPKLLWGGKREARKRTRPPGGSRGPQLVRRLVRDAHGWVAAGPAPSASCSGPSF